MLTQLKQLLFASCLLLIVFTRTTAQELNCVVSINVGPAVQISDQTVFKDMKNAFQQFMNTRKWTNDAHKVHEKIACSIRININEMPSIGLFKASVQIQSARPIYNSNYYSPTLNFGDRDWEFEYIESQPLEFNDNAYTSNITSLLAYYAYVIIGMDYDTFSELGGTPHFQKAQTVVINAQAMGREGWQTLGNNRNRYWLVENLLSGQMLDVRKGMYAYHRLAMDTFDKTPDQSREIILKHLRDIKKARDVNPGSILVISFFDAKAKELGNVFSDGNLQVRTRDPMEK